MLTPARFNIGRMAVGTSILLAICALSISAGCASVSRLSSNLSQSPLGGRHAGLIPGSWDRVVVLRPGVRMVVTLMDGARLDGDFRTLGPDDLGVTDSAGREFGVPRSTIRQVVVRGDAVMDGALIGAGIGAATAATIVAIAASGDGYVLPSAKWGAPLLLSAVGGVIGVFIDHAHRDDRLVYVSP